MARSPGRGSAALAAGEQPVRLVELLRLPDIEPAVRVREVGRDPVARRREPEVRIEDRECPGFGQESGEFGRDYMYPREGELPDRSACPPRLDPQVFTLIHPPQQAVVVEEQ